MNQQTQVVTKLARARELCDLLQVEVNAFLATNPYSTYVEADTNEPGTVLRLRAKSEPPERWGAIVGDIVHNLRSCLDVAVYQLVEFNSGNADSDTAFPMSRSAATYQSNADLKTKGIHPGARDAIDQSKPYPGGNDDLYLLHELDIEDKHHLLLALAAGGDMGLAIGPPLGPRPDGSFLQQIQRFSRAHSKHLFPLRDGSMLMRTDATIGDPHAMMEHFHFFPYIAMKPTKWELHEDLFVLLNRLGTCAQEVVDALSPFFDTAREQTSV